MVKRDRVSLMLQAPRLVIHQYVSVARPAPLLLFLLDILFQMDWYFLAE